MEEVTITITGSRSGDASYKIKFDEGELLLFKMQLANAEKSSSKLKE